MKRLSLHPFYQRLLRTTTRLTQASCFPPGLAWLCGFDADGLLWIQPSSLALWHVQTIAATDALPGSGDAQNRSPLSVYAAKGKCVIAVDVSGTSISTALISLVQNLREQCPAIQSVLITTSPYALAFADSWAPSLAVVQPLFATLTPLLKVPVFSMPATDPHWEAALIQTILTGFQGATSAVLLPGHGVIIATTELESLPESIQLIELSAQVALLKL